MPHALDVYAELSFGHGLLRPEYLNMDKVFSSSIAEKKETKQKQNRKRW
jgi:hypothetical protein